MRRNKSESNVKEYVQEQMESARKQGKITCTLYTCDEDAFVDLLNEMHLTYITPRVGCYIVSVEY